ncbi:hypothetical protein CBL_11185 [Carabus blaptoides fortunei]
MNKTKARAFKQNDKLYKDATNQKKSKIIRTIHATNESDDNENVLNTIPSEETFKNNSKSTQYIATHPVVDENIKQDGNFILEKFLSDAINKNQNSPTSNSSFPKLPVPLPRKNKNTSLCDPKKSSSTSSAKTYSIASPQIEDTIDKLSIASGATYNINENAESEQDSTSSGATYNINKNRNNLKVKSKKMVHKDSSTLSSDTGSVIIPVGDILIHTSPTSKSSVQVIQNKPSLNASPEFRQFENGIQYHSTTSHDAVLKNGKKYNRKHSKIPKIKKKFEANRTIITDSETDDKIKANEQERTSKDKKHKTKSKFEDDSNVDKDLYTCDNLIGITVYKTDQLLLNALINHPCVKVHIVDSTTGEYIRRSKHDDQNTEYLEPSLTKPYNLQEKRSLIPQWEETLTFNEDFNYILEYENTVIFFEILDFVTFSTACLNYRTEGANSGWYKVAWAFLKPVAKNGHLNTEKLIRLQLYKPQKYSKKTCAKKCILFDWWTSGNLTKYPSTLKRIIKYTP